MLQNPDRLGYYLVDNKKYYNKPLAMIAASQSNKELTWVFNDDVYRRANWFEPIEESLNSIYHRRAQQLRDQYDYLVLYYSGGADSINILHAFIDNDIFLDEIVMQLPEPMRTTFDPRDTSMGNIYSELEFAGIPHLNKFRHLINPKTKIRYQDFAKPVLELLKRDDWALTNPLGTNICISGIGRQYVQLSEEHILKLCETGISVAQILGVDKPLVGHDEHGYFAYFLDVSAMHAPPVTASQAEIFKNHYHTEFFYWTPSMPEIVVKQAQEIKKFYESHPQGEQIAAQSTKIHISHFKKILHPIIYPEYVKVDFETEKPSSKIVRPMDAWFWEIADKKTVNNYTDVIKHLKQKVAPHYFINNDINNGIQGHRSDNYYL